MEEGKKTSNFNFKNSLVRYRVRWEQPQRTRCGAGVGRVH